MSSKKVRTPTIPRALPMPADAGAPSQDLVDAQAEDDRRYMGLARAQAEFSQDPSTKVCAIILTSGGAKGQSTQLFADLADPTTATRNERYASVIHAELAVLLEAGVQNAQGATLYVTHEPCNECWKAIAASRVARVVHGATDEERRDRWMCDGPGRRAFEGMGGVVVELP